MRVNGQDGPLHEVAPWFESLWETHADFTCSPWSGEPALINAWPGPRGIRPGVKDDTKDFNTADMPFDRFIKPEPDFTGRLGNHCFSCRHRAHQSGMCCQP